MEDLDRRALAEGRKSGLVPLPAEVNARMSHLRRGWYWGAAGVCREAKKTSGPKASISELAGVPADTACRMGRRRLSGW